MLQREMSPLDQRFLIRQEAHDLWRLPLGAVAMTQSPIDELVAILDPLLHKLVGSGLSDASNIFDLVVGMPSLSWFSERPKSEVHNVGLEVL